MKQDDERLGQMQRQSNILYGNIVDKAFHFGAGVRLIDFEPAERLYPIGENQRRYKQQIALPSGATHWRPCSENVEIGERWLEDAFYFNDDDAVFEPTVYGSLDRCAVGRGWWDWCQIGPFFVYVVLECTTCGTFYKALWIKAM